MACEMVARLRVMGGYKLRAHLLAADCGSSMGSNQNVSQNSTTNEFSKKALISRFEKSKQLDYKQLVVLPFLCISSYIKSFLRAYYGMS